MKHTVLIEKVFKEIAKKTNNIVDLSILSEFEETVDLTYHVFGLIEINGFDGVLWDEMDADPGYLRTIAAFHGIGSDKVANALQEGLKLINDRKCRYISKKQFDDEFLIQERKFLSKEKKIIKNIYNYIKPNK